MADGSNGNDWGSAAVTRTDESDWGSLGPSADEGWGQKVSDGWGASAMDGWTVANIKANPTQQITRKEGPPLARNAADDEPTAEKEVDKICASALDGKKKIAAIRAQLDDLDEKRAVVQGQIDELMPELQEIRAQKGTALGVVQGARMPALWTDKAREMNTRRKTLPGGCTTTLELKRAIKETERSIEHGSLSLKEEKAALDRVRELNRGKEIVKEYELDQLELDRVKAEYTSQQAELKPLNQSLDQLKAIALEKGGEMDKMMAERESQKEARAAASAKMAELRANLDSCFEKVRSHQADAPKAVARFFAAVRDLDAKLNKDRAPPPLPVPAAPVAVAPETKAPPAAAKPAKAAEPKAAKKKTAAKEPAKEPKKDKKAKKGKSKEGGSAGLLLIGALGTVALAVAAYLGLGSPESLAQATARLQAKFA